MNVYRFTIILLLCASFDAMPVQGAPLITSTGTGTLFSGDSVTVGNIFAVGAKPITLTALGIFDSGTPGLDQAHSVGLWTTAGVLLAEADFAPGLNGFSDNGFQYLNLASPVVLQAGQDYVLGASYSSGTTDMAYVNDTGQYETWSPAVTFLHGRYTVSGAGFAFPSDTVGGASYVGPNAEFGPVPEQTNTLVLLLCSVAPCLLWRARRDLAFNATL